MSKDEVAKELLQDILKAVVSEQAGTTDLFMYIWQDKWIPLKERIQQYLKEEHESTN